MTTTRAPADDLAPPDAPIPFARLVSTELRKLSDTRASRWLLVAILATTTVVIAVMVFVMAPHDLTYNKLVDYSTTPQKVLLPAVGILAMTSEWSQRTGLVTFTLVPNRSRVLAAKFLATVCLGLVVSAVTFTAAALGNLAAIGLRQADGSWTFGIAGIAEMTLVQLIGLVEGMAFGMAWLVTAAALVTYYALPTLWSALFSSTGLKPAEGWVDLNQAGGNLYNQQITGVGWLQLLVAATLWILVPLIVGMWRIGHTDIRTS